MTLEKTQSPEEEGRALVERLGGRWGASGGMCRCPAHDDRTPSLSVRPGRERLLLHCFAGCDSADVLRALQSKGLIEPEGGHSHGESVTSSRRSFSRAALALWSEARPIAGTPAQSYLLSRGLATDSPELRYHRRTPHGPKPFTELRPALIAAVRDGDGLVAIHRTFIEPAGRGLAAISNPRCGLGRLGSGAVRLGGGGPRLGLAEGIETALSASLLFGIPCWATLGAERFGSVSIPAEVEELVLFLDQDRGGRRAEARARERLGRRYRIEALYPPHAGDDWNDLLQGSQARLHLLRDALPRRRCQGAAGSEIPSEGHIGKWRGALLEAGLPCGASPETRGSLGSGGAAGAERAAPAPAGDER